MSITTAKAKNASQRFMLVRLAYAKILDSTVVDIGSQRYTFTAEANFYGLEVNGVAYTAVASVTPTTNQYNYNSTTGLVTFFFNGSIQEALTINSAVSFHYIYLTGEEAQLVGKNPATPGTDIVEWQPRIASYPTIKQSVKNMLSGVFSIENSSISILNTDNYLQNFLTPKHTFNNKAVDVWLCIDSVTNIQKIFEGKISKVSLNKEKAQINFYDSFSKLNYPAYFGDSLTEAFYQTAATIFPPDQGLPIPYITGPSSRFGRIYTTPGTSPNILSWTQYDTATMNRATCMDYAQALGYTTNRVYGTCRIGPDTRPVSYSGAVLTVSVVLQADGGPMTIITYTSTGLDACKYGDTIKLTEGATVLYGYVEADEFVSSTSRKIYIRHDTGAIPSWTTAVVATGYSSMSIAIKQVSNNLIFRPLQGRDYTVSETTTTGGNVFLKVNFINSWETIYPTMDVFHPANHQVFYRISTNTTTMKSGAFLQDLCEKAGMTCNAATFAAVDAAILTAADVQMSIPHFGESDFDSYRKYAEDVLISLNAYLRLNNSLEVEYKTATLPAAGTVINDDDILKGSLDINIDYNDIVTRFITVNNDGNRTGTGYVAHGPADPVNTFFTNKARYLNGGEKVVKREISANGTFIPQVAYDIRSYRKVHYRFKTATKNMDTLLGDNLTLQGDFVLGGTDTVNVVVVSIDKSVDGVTIEATDLKES